MWFDQLKAFFKGPSSNLPPAVSGGPTFSGNLLLKAKGSVDLQLSGNLEALQDCMLEPDFLSHGKVICAGALTVKSGATINGPIQASALYTEDHTHLNGSLQIEPPHSHSPAQ
ncbi:MAG: hypothetical protein AAFY98_11480 [Verrucomicrobiota bacterium]